jgi:hypothetical protein
MKILFEKFVIALEQYANDSRSVMKRAIQEQAIKAVKLDLANELKLHLKTDYLDKDQISHDDYDKLLKAIGEIQKQVAEKREGRKIKPGYFDALLIWMSDRLNAAKEQSMLPLSFDPQFLIKNKLDQFIVLLGGFSDFPDSRNSLELWSKDHSRMAVYPAAEGWDEKILSSEDKITSIAEQVEALKQATIVQLRNQADDQVKNTLYYMTVTELSKISPVLYPLSKSLTETFDLKPLVLKKEKVAVEQATVKTILISEEEKQETLNFSPTQKQTMVFSSESTGWCLGTGAPYTHKEVGFTYPDENGDQTRSMTKPYN